MSFAWLQAAVAVAIAPGPATAAPPLLRWTSVATAGPEDLPTALASDGSGRLVVGGARGVRELSASRQRRAAEMLLRRGPVADLAFLADGSLLVATAQGLYRVPRRGEPERESLSTDPASRAVSRLAAVGGMAVAGTERGVYLRRADARWLRVLELPAAPASLVALRARGTDLELWSVAGGELWIAGLRPGEDDRLLYVRSTRLPVAPGAEGAVDVAFDLPGADGADAVICFPTDFAVLEEGSRWRRLRPALPPGARLRRIARAFGRLWLATDAGLLSAPGLSGPWRRAAPEVGSRPVLDLAGGATLAVATSRGVLVARAAGGAAARPAAGADAAAPPDAAPLRHLIREGPSIGALHAAVIRYQGLETGYLRDMRRRVLRRAWLPELNLSFGYRDQRDRSRDRDETFSSGATRHLFDRADDRGRDLDMGLTLSWELGDSVFHPDEIDVSREARLVISLRDDVLDEVTQLYFERLRVLSQLEVAEDPAEQQALALRAAELAAGLDAWTGGRFSRPAP